MTDPFRLLRTFFQAGPPEGWDPVEVTERLRRAAHGHPEHQAARERWAEEEPKRYCEWCEADPDTEHLFA